MNVVEAFAIRREGKAAQVSPGEEVGETFPRLEIQQFESPRSFSPSFTSYRSKRPSGETRRGLTAVCLPVSRLADRPKVDPRRLRLHACRCTAALGPADAFGKNSGHQRFAENRRFRRRGILECAPGYDRVLECSLDRPAHRVSVLQSRPGFLPNPGLRASDTGR